MRRRALLLFVATAGVLAGIAAACSSYGESDGKAPTNDGGASAAPLTDVVPPDGEHVATELDGGGGACDRTSEFKQFARVDSLSVVGNQELGARLTRDELAVVISRGYGTGTYDLHVASRNSEKEPFGAATPLDTLNTPAMETHASLSGDGFMIVFDSDRDGGLGMRDLYVATRSNGVAAFGNIMNMSATINGPADDMMPYLLPNKQRVYFTSTRDGNIGRLFVAAFPSNSQPERVFSDPSAVGSHPVVTDDDLEIFFSGNEENNPSSSAILWARRSSVSAPFGPPVVLNALNVRGAFDRPTWISADGCRLYFTSDRTAANDYDVYVATR